MDQGRAMIVFILLTVVLSVDIVTADVRTKRLVLHSDDMAAEIGQLRADFAAQNALIQNLNDTVNAQAKEIEQLKAMSGVFGVWVILQSLGKDNMPKLNVLGNVAGTYWDSSWQGDGDGANYLCLPETPIWDHTVASLDNNIRVTGVEYSFYPFVKSTTQFFGSEIDESQAPCAMCHVKRGTNIMIPGRTECYPGWTKEYGGYLVTSYAGYDDASEYVCLDRRPEVVPNSASAAKNNWLYFVEAKCSSGLECPPSIDGLELACVVCSI